MATSHLIVGLGNPGADYQNTRHNIGFMAVERIASHYRASHWKQKFKGLIATPAPDTSVSFLLLKPQTYMNLSGESVAEAMRFHKLTPPQIWVFHDDLDLPLAHMRVKKGGGTGGHNGLKSIDAHIGKDYGRVRLGIGRPAEKGDVVTNYVLAAFTKADHVWLDPLLDAAAAQFDLLLEGEGDRYVKKVLSALTS